MDASTITTVEQNKQYYRDQLRWISFKPSVGGQHTTVMYYPQTLVCDELLFHIEIGYYRSQIKNREIAMVLFELFLDDVIK